MAPAASATKAEAGDLKKKNADDSNIHPPAQEHARHSKPNKDTKHLKLYMHPPSIPTKFQTIHYDDSESKGFNSTSRRFEQYMDDLPGPGYYAKAAEKVEQIGLDASISKKGFVGFASNSRRFIKPPTDLETTLPVSPAQYNPRTPTYSYSLSHSLSPAFRSPIALRSQDAVGPQTSTVSHFRSSWNSKSTPGPGQYNPVYEGKPRKRYGQTEGGAEFVFKSRSSRSEVGAGGTIPGKDAPPPGVYDITRAEKVVARGIPAAFAAFKATARAPLSHQQRVPGPGSYEIESANPHHDPTRYIRLRGRAGKIAPPPPRPMTPLSTQVAVPGSGTTPIAFPSPGHYNIADCANNIQRTVPMPRSIFLSKTPRFSTQPESHPGPGFYHPIPDIKFRSFRLNIDNHWI